MAVPLTIVGFHGHGGTQKNSWFIRKNHIKMDDLGVPLFQEMPNWKLASISYHVARLLAGENGPPVKIEVWTVCLIMLRLGYIVAKWGYTNHLIMMMISIIVITLLSQTIINDIITIHECYYVITIVIVAIGCCYYYVWYVVDTLLICCWWWLNHYHIFSLFYICILTPNDLNLNILILVVDISYDYDS